MENEPLKFASGMNFKARHPNAPETVRGSIYFKATEFKKFLDENVDEKGYVNVKMMKSKRDGAIYFIWDSFKPKSLSVEESKAYHNRYSNTDETMGGTSPIRHQHTDPQVQQSNEKMSQEMFGKPLSEEEEYNLSQAPF